MRSEVAEEGHEGGGSSGGGEQEGGSGDESRARKLEGNRQAAKQSRKRKKQREEELGQAVAELMASNESLSIANLRLTAFVGFRRHFRGLIEELVMAELANSTRDLVELRQLLRQAAESNNREAIQGLVNRIRRAIEHDVVQEILRQLPERER